MAYFTSNGQSERRKAGPRSATKLCGGPATRQEPTMASLLPKQGLYTNTLAPANHIPDELTEWDQWLCWKYGKKRSDGKRTKEPVGHTKGR